MNSRVHNMRVFVLERPFNFSSNFTLCSINVSCFKSILNVWADKTLHEVCFRLENTNTETVKTQRHRVTHGGGDKGELKVGGEEKEGVKWGAMASEEAGEGLREHLMLTEASRSQPKAPSELKHWVSVHVCEFLCRLYIRGLLPFYWSVNVVMIGDLHLQHCVREIMRPDTVTERHPLH